MVWVAGWAQGLDDGVLVALRPGLDELLLVQRQDGVLLAERSAVVGIDPGVRYRVSLRYEVGRFRLRFGGEELFDEPNAFAGEPFGTVGFGAHGGPIAVEWIAVVENRQTSETRDQRTAR